ncbi:Lrp/AsnC family transcriptional regulator [Amycolatopsis sp. PS_44_ISF1]|uniref:Lrp/AsnC family transcriptional regulator n=1 Tax=Amycolatopsis sp. PS_44_ISF1 TaxID=2974917 RepID=UPI0028DF5A47|nr:Lrp/AsnC family transcriptional regulator [Amycolatopsis sp. PS_44_ISF1]MDT8913866.1 Lrp/AsnC family transcriptional regulator [Amycolatopsis sp. PS_44_ISF1]
MATSDQSTVFDGLDLQLIHALQLDGRAPFSTIARVLGVSDQTVARRYARLRSAGRLRVTGRTDPARLGEVWWFVRVRCTPNVARTVGRALARRPDTSWVKLTSGGTEIVATVRAPTSQDSEALLLEQLPRTPQVLDVSANCLLHVFFGGRQSIVEALSPAQVARLGVAPPDPAPGPVTLDEGDRKLLALLDTDGRTGFTALAAATGRPVTTLRRRLAELRASGAVYFDVDYDYRGLRLSSQTLLWLSVAPDRLLAAGRALGAHAEVPFAAATTGSTNLFASVLCPDPAALFGYLTTAVAALPGVQRTETAPVIQTLKTL